MRHNLEKLREEGFYKTRIGKQWIVAEYADSNNIEYYWWIAGFEERYNDDDFDEIGEKIELP